MRETPTDLPRHLGHHSPAAAGHRGETVIVFALSPAAMVVSMMQTRCSF
ncbi:hypothetical protein ABZW18_30030 [Streptomyces sp. NPDC004647]